MSETDTRTGIDPSLILRPHEARLEELQHRWHLALPQVGAEFGLSEHEASPVNLQEKSVRAWMSEREKAPDSPVVIGIAGPGASGKGTISEYLERTLGYPKIVNTTTRPPRHHETHGEHYHFLSAEEFEQKKVAGDFLTVTERPGRGTYAISKSEVESKLANHGQGCVIEENPHTLLTALEATGAEHGHGERLTALLYILPPEPIMNTLALRLHDRSAASHAERKLTAEDIESTLGDRQIDEFTTLSLASQYPDVNVVFLVNGNLEQTHKKLDILFGMNQENSK
jgi:guanylate kinase